MTHIQGPTSPREMGEYSYIAADQDHQCPEYPHQPRLQVPGRMHRVGRPETGQFKINEQPRLTPVFSLFFSLTMPPPPDLLT